MNIYSLHFPLRAYMVLLFAFGLTVCSAQADDAMKSFIPKPMKDSLEQQREAVTDLLKRLLPHHHDQFRISFLPPSKEKDHFELESKDGKIELKGNNGVSIASALHYYIKNYLHGDISWNGIHLPLPKVLPHVENKIRKDTPYEYRYYLNYCTYQYSMAWWDWSRWEKEIDWMALNGINMPLALTGEEAIWQEVYRDMGFSDGQLANFFTGPAFFSWNWMGNIDAWGGPLPRHWIDSHRTLQQKILERERALGMTPILPAFTGHVPPDFVKKFPQAKVKRTNWDAGFEDVFILDPDDPMFEEIGKKFIKVQTRIYGTDHLYSADTFNENVPPTNDSLYLSNMSKKVFQSMASADPKAVWVMQGWMFSYNNAFWKPTQIKALLNAVPHEQMLILDLWSETHPVWKETEAFYGKPWIWNMLHNFGGNISLFGRMNEVANGPANALNDPRSGAMAGIGLTPEGIEQNPVMYALMLENVWRNSPIPLDDWLKDYAFRRYGKRESRLDSAWQILKNTVYSGGKTEGGPESIIVARPTFARETQRAKTALSYDPLALAKAWDIWISVAPSYRGNAGFEYDLVDITRQVLANYASPLQAQWIAAYEKQDTLAFRQNSEAFIDLIQDMDRLLSTKTDFLLGKWIEDARACGMEKKEKDLYEFNARCLITLWGHPNTNLSEYANRQWAGLLSQYYRPRWEQYFSYLRSCLGKHQNFDQQQFDAGIKEWEWSWVNAHDTYSANPQGDPIWIAQELYEKYRTAITSIPPGPLN